MIGITAAACFTDTAGLQFGYSRNSSWLHKFHKSTDLLKSASFRYNVGGRLIYICGILLCLLCQSWKDEEKVSRRSIRKHPAETQEDDRRADFKSNKAVSSACVPDHRLIGEPHAAADHHRLSSATAPGNTSHSR